MPLFVPEKSVKIILECGRIICEYTCADYKSKECANRYFRGDFWRKRNFSQNNMFLKGTRFHRFFESRVKKTA